jgi:hypothetical protein
LALVIVDHPAVVGRLVLRIEAVDGPCSDRVAHAALATLQIESSACEPSLQQWAEPPTQAGKTSPIRDLLVHRPEIASYYRRK